MARKRVIALDDGHGMATSGKRTPALPNGLKSPETGKNFMHENEFNRAVMKYLKEHLERCGFETLLVAPTDADTSLEARVKLANTKKVDLYVAIHANASKGTWGTWGGAETFVWPSGESQRIGQIVHKHLMMGTPLRNRGVKNGSQLYVIRKTNMPAILIEAAFMDNLEEAKLLMEDRFRRECALEIAKGICEAYGVAYIEATVAKAPTPTPVPTPAKSPVKTKEPTVEGGDDKLKLAQWQLDEMAKLFEKAVAEKVFTDKQWIDKVKKGDMTQSEALYLLSAITLRKWENETKKK